VAGWEVIGLDRLVQCSTRAGALIREGIMPRRPRNQKRKITVVVGGKPIAVTMFPPGGNRKSWYAYWTGLVASKSTGERDFGPAVAVAEHMVRNGGKRGRLADTILTDDEFEAIQRAHYGKKQDAKAKARAEKTLRTCLEAIAAFREISGVSPISTATADDCARFQQEALKRPKNWRLSYPNRKKEGVERISPNTVLKWSRAIQAAFERANVNGGKKCIRGVVDDKKLLTENPWQKFTWIEERRRGIRQFNAEELLAVLDYFDSHWNGVKVVLAAAKTFLWSWSRLSEVAGLRWDDLRVFAEEYHFEIVGKMGVEKWARVPCGLYEELRELKTGSPYVFAAHNRQLQTYYRGVGQARFAGRVSDEFSPRAFADWFQEKLGQWGEVTGNEHATPHVFRKTALQHARSGEDLNSRVARDARLTESVMMTHYVTERDEELRQASNRTYHRILASLPSDVACRYGHRAENGAGKLELRLRQATEAQDWTLVRELAGKLAEAHK
jgi:integrase